LAFASRVGEVGCYFCGVVSAIMVSCAAMFPW
jgi:hypothetical protein